MTDQSFDVWLDLATLRRVKYKLGDVGLMKKLLAVCLMSEAFLLNGLLVQQTWADVSKALDQPKPLKAIEFVLVEDNLEQFGVRLNARTIQQQARANLNEWEFPMQASAPFSHQLQARLGLISHQATPVGFSFSSGSSDPRAMDYQKADVLPITCSLFDTDTQQLLLERASTFSAHELNKKAGLASITDKLTDQISTICLEVLEDAPKPVLADDQVKTTTIKPKWMPDVKVEVIEPPAPAPVVKGSTGSGSSAVPSPVLKEEPRKELIIHNQGTPVIIQMGHERK
jgi:hypothetical protein